MQSGAPGYYNLVKDTTSVGHQWIPSIFPNGVYTLASAATPAPTPVATPAATPTATPATTPASTITTAGGPGSSGSGPMPVLPAFTTPFTVIKCADSTTLSTCQKTSLSRYASKWQSSEVVIQYVVILAPTQDRRTA